MTLWLDADGLSVAPGRPGGPSIGEPKARAQAVRPDSVPSQPPHGLCPRAKVLLMW